MRTREHRVGTEEHEPEIRDAPAISPGTQHPASSSNDTTFHQLTESSAAPIPPAERTLPVIQAQHWLQVSNEQTVLEGPSLDRKGRLLFTDPIAARLLRTGADEGMEALGDFAGSGPGGTAIHRDGRLFVAVTADHYTRGWIVALQPDGSAPRMIVAPQRGHVPNDLVFDSLGGFYFSDFRGTSTEPAGGVYYVSPDTQAITPVLPHIARANGVALSPDGKTLWITEHGNNRLHRVKLQSATKPADNGTTVLYHFAGPPPDSMRTDRDGNLYVAMNGQGRVLIFASNGVPIAQILLPGRDQGRYLDTTNLALSADDDTLYIVSGDRQADSGAAIFRATALAPGLRLFSHQ